MMQSIDESHMLFDNQFSSRLRRAQQDYAMDTATESFRNKRAQRRHQVHGIDAGIFSAAPLFSIQDAK